MVGSRSEKGPKIGIFSDFSENFRKILCIFRYTGAIGIWLEGALTDFALVCTYILTATIDTFITVSQTLADNEIFIGFSYMEHPNSIGIHFVHPQFNNCDVYKSNWEEVYELE